MLLDQTLNILTVFLWALFFILVLVSLGVALRRGLASALGMLIARVPLLFGVMLLIITFVKLSLVFIEPQQVGVVVSVLTPDGIYDRPYRSGLRWVVPFFEQVYRYPIYWQTYTMAASPFEGQKTGNDAIQARTLDGQEVTLDSSIIFQIDPEQAVRIHIDWQERYLNDFVRPVMRGVVRDIVAKYTAHEVNSSKRDNLESDINKQISDTFKQKGFTVDRFILRNIAFSPEYAAAIEDKQVALQRVIESQHQAEAILIKAQAEADALKLIADALARDKNLLTYQYINKLTPGIRVILVPSNAPFLLNLPDLGLGDAPTTTLPITATRPITTPGR